MQIHLADRWLDDPRDGAARSRLVWLVAAVLACALLVAFWSVCNAQVRKAESRQAARPTPSTQECDPGFALPAMGHCPARVVVGTR